MKGGVHLATAVIHINQLDDETDQRDLAVIWILTCS